MRESKSTQQKIAELWTGAVLAGKISTYDARCLATFFALQVKCAEGKLSRLDATLSDAQSIVNNKKKIESISLPERKCKWNGCNDSAEEHGYCGSHFATL